MILISLSSKSLMSNTVSDFTLFTNFQIYTTSLAIYLIAIYSALVMEIEIALCYLFFYEITTPFRKKLYPITNF